MPRWLEEALQGLAEDHEFLLEGGVFTEDLIETWIEYKMDGEGPGKWCSSPHGRWP